MALADGQELLLCSAGDLMLCDSPLRVGVGLGTAYKWVRNRIFAPCTEDFQAADLVIGNFESVVYHPKRRNLSELQMACPPDAAALLRETGFDVLNIANNHCIQHGAEAFLHTRDVCRKHGMQAVGAHEDPPCIMEVKGQRIVFLSLSLLPEKYHPEEIVYEHDIEYAFSQIEEYAKPDDLLIVMIHWGNEFATYPYNKQVALAHRFADSGADLILGHHSHVFQGIEQYGDSLIVYSQGNLAADMPQALCRETGYVKIRIAQQDGRRVISYEMIPLQIRDDLTLEAGSGDWFAERQEQLSAVLRGEVSDADYFRMVDSNHAKCSAEFQKRFRQDLRKYPLRISAGMVTEAVMRKIRKTKRSDQYATQRKEQTTDRTAG